MVVHRNRRPAQVIGPFGEMLRLADLPENNMTRWVIRRKAEVVAAVHGGLLSLEEACSRYRLSLEEFCSWQESIEKSGLPGLRISRLSQYRTAEPDTTAPGSRASAGDLPSSRNDVGLTPREKILVDLHD